MGPPHLLRDRVLRRTSPRRGLGTSPAPSRPPATAARLGPLRSQLRCRPHEDEDDRADADPPAARWAAAALDLGGVPRDVRSRRGRGGLRGAATARREEQVRPVPRQELRTQAADQGPRSARSAPSPEPRLAPQLHHPRAAGRRGAADPHAAHPSVHQEGDRVRGLHRVRVGGLLPRGREAARRGPRRARRGRATGRGRRRRSRSRRRPAAHSGRRTHGATRAYEAGLATAPCYTRCYTQRKTPGITWGFSVEAPGVEPGSEGRRKGPLHVCGQWI